MFSLSVRWPGEVLHKVVPVIPLIAEGDFPLRLRVEQRRRPVFHVGGDQLHRYVRHVAVHVVVGQVHVLVEVPGRTSCGGEKAEGREGMDRMTE